MSIKIAWSIAIISTALCLFLWFRDVRRIMQGCRSTVESAASQLKSCQTKAAKAGNDPDADAILKRSEGIYRQAVELYCHTLRKKYIWFPAFLMGFNPFHFTRMRCCKKAETKKIQQKDYPKGKRNRNYSMKEEQETLLDTLHQLAGCEYMSDLKSETQRDCLMRVITGMDISRYSADTWTKAASYLFQRDICFQTMDEVQTFLATEKAKSERMEG